MEQNEPLKNPEEEKCAVATDSPAEQISTETDVEVEKSLLEAGPSKIASQAIMTPDSGEVKVTALTGSFAVSFEGFDTQSSPTMEEGPALERAASDNAAENNRAQDETLGSVGSEEKSEGTTQEAVEEVFETVTVSGVVYEETESPATELENQEIPSLDVDDTKTEVEEGSLDTGKARQIENEVVVAIVQKIETREHSDREKSGPKTVANDSEQQNDTNEEGNFGDKQEKLEASDLSHENDHTEEESCAALLKSDADGEGALLDKTFPTNSPNSGGQFENSVEKEQEQQQQNAENDKPDVFLVQAGQEEEKIELGEEELKTEIRMEEDVLESADKVRTQELEVDDKQADGSAVEPAESGQGSPLLQQDDEIRKEQDETRRQMDTIEQENCGEALEETQSKSHEQDKELQEPTIENLAPINGPSNLKEAEETDKTDTDPTAQLSECIEISNQEEKPEDEPKNIDYHSCSIATKDTGDIINLNGDTMELQESALANSDLGKQTSQDKEHIPSVQESFGAEGPVTEDEDAVSKTETNIEKMQQDKKDNILQLVTAESCTMVAEGELLEVTDEEVFEDTREFLCVKESESLSMESSMPSVTAQEEESNPGAAASAGPGTEENSDTKEDNIRKQEKNIPTEDSQHNLALCDVSQDENGGQKSRNKDYIPIALSAKDFEEVSKSSGEAQPSPKADTAVGEGSKGDSNSSDKKGLRRRASKKYPSSSRSKSAVPEPKSRSHFKDIKVLTWNSLELINQNCSLSIQISLSFCATDLKC